MKLNKAKVSDWLKLVRLSRGLTVVEFAKAVGVSPVSVRRWEARMTVPTFTIGMKALLLHPGGIDRVVRPEGVDLSTNPNT